MKSCFDEFEIHMYLRDRTIDVDRGLNARVIAFTNENYIVVLNAKHACDLE